MLCQLLHCTPADLDDCEAWQLDLYREFYQEGKREARFEEKRAEAKAKLSRNK